MDRFVFLVEQISIGLYILCAVGIIVSLWAYFRGRQALAAAQFELERELARYRTSTALTITLALIEVGLAVLAIALVVAPTLRDNPPRQNILPPGVVQVDRFTTDVPDNLESTPPPDFSQGVEIPGLEDELNLQPFATPTLTPTPVGTILPDVAPAVGCDGGAQLRIPANGMVVFEATKIMGVATAENFAFYRFELNGPSTNNTWSRLADYTIPVADGELGQIVPAQLIPGEYRFALKVFDINSELRASCTITIIISEPIPTATPIRES